MQGAQGNVTGRKPSNGTGGRKPLTVSGFAIASGHSRRKTLRAIAMGQLRAFEFAGQLLIPYSELIRVQAMGADDQEFVSAAE